MHAEPGTDKRHSAGPGGRRVRALLGLPDQAAGVQGHTPLPPGAFHYQRQAGLAESFTPAPVSQGQAEETWVSENIPDAVGGKNEGTPTTDAVEPEQIARQMTARTDGGERVAPQPVSPDESRQAEHAGQTRPAGAHQDHHPGIALTGQCAPSVQSMPEIAAVTADPVMAKPSRLAAPNSRASAEAEKVTPSGHRQEIAIPGRSMARQVFAALAAATDRDEPRVADQPQSLDQVRHGTTAAVDRKQAESPTAPSTADRQPSPHPRPLPAAAQAVKTSTPAAQTSTPTAARHGRTKAGKVDQLANTAAGNRTAQDSTAAIVTPVQETPRTELQPGGRHLSLTPDQANTGSARFTAALTPARPPEEDGTRRIEELRRTFYELVSRKATVSEARDNGPGSGTAAESPARPPLQQVVVINRIAGARSRGRAPYAFWERSGMARETLKMIR